MAAYPKPREVVTTEPGRSFEGSATARIRDLEKAVEGARFALGYRRCGDHAGVRCSTCPSCVADEILEGVQR